MSQRTLKRVTSLMLALVSIGLVIGWTLGAVLMVRVARLAADVEVMRARLDPVAPIDVLCEVSAQVRQVYAGVQEYWRVVHGQHFPPVQPPPICRGRPALSVPHERAAGNPQQ